MLGKTSLPRLSPREPRNSFHKSFIRKPSLSQKRPTTVFQSPPSQRRATLYPWGQIKLNLCTSKKAFVLRGSKFMTAGEPKGLWATWRNKVNRTLSFCWWGCICSFCSSPFEVFLKGRKSPAQPHFKNYIQHIPKSTLKISHSSSRSSRAVLEKGTILVQQ